MFKFTPVYVEMLMTYGRTYGLMLFYTYERTADFMITRAIEVLYTENIRALKTDCFDFYAKQLPEEEQARINRYKRPEDRQAALLGKALLISTFADTGTDWLQLKRNDYGKPYFDETGNEAHFNISHSGDYVVAAVNRYGVVGVDIEKIRPLDLSGFKQFFSEEEWQNIHGHKNALQQFFTYWSIKEAVVKAVGKGLSLPLSDVRISGDSVRIDGQAYYFREILLHDDYRFMVAAPDSSYNIVLSDCTHHFEWL